MRLLVVVVVFGLCALVSALKVRKCGSEDPLEDNPNINVSSCEKIPCKFKRKTTIEVEMKFQPGKEIPKVVNSVHAKILGIPFPFIGVDGNAICEKVFDPTGAKAGCPLQDGKDYVYKDSFKILEIYPKIKVWVHWSIVDEKGNDVLCFEVPVRITG